MSDAVQRHSSIFDGRGGHGGGGTTPGVKAGLAALLFAVMAAPATAKEISLDVEMGHTNYTRLHHGVYLDGLWIDPTPFTMNFTFADTVTLRSMGENQASYSIGQFRTAVESKLISGLPDFWYQYPRHPSTPSFVSVLQDWSGTELRTSVLFTFKTDHTETTDSGNRYRTTTEFRLGFTYLSEKTDAPTLDSTSLLQFLNGEHGALEGTGGFDFYEQGYVLPSSEHSAYHATLGWATPLHAEAYPVPEPTTWALMGGGLALLGWRARRRLST